MRHSIVGAVVLLALLTVTQTANGQGRPVEFGIDGGLGLRRFSDIPDQAFVTIPVERFRVGFLLSNRAMLEPSASVTWTSSDDASIINTELGLSLVYHLQDLGGIITYFTVGGGIRASRGKLNIGGPDITDGETEPILGFGFGLKLPIIPRIAFRSEIRFDHTFGSGADPDPLDPNANIEEFLLTAFPSSDRAEVRLGISFFTR